MAPSQLTRGCVYVANAEAYIQASLRSAKSLKEAMPSAQIALIAPEPLWIYTNNILDFLIKPELDDLTPIVKSEAPKAPFDEVAFV